jgi:hypothetical protein
MLVFVQGFDNELGRGAQGQGGFNPLNPQGGGLGGLGGPRVSAYMNCYKEDF